MTERTIVDYKVLENTDSRAMTKDVTRMMELGWHVYGPLSVASSSEYSANYTLFQTMVKYAPPSKMDTALLIG